MKTRSGSSDPLVPRNAKPTAWALNFGRSLLCVNAGVRGHDWSTWYSERPGQAALDPQASPPVVPPFTK
jgi:hypothetical protein